jgi:hypothetical protein
MLTLRRLLILRLLGRLIALLTELLHHVVR